MFLAKFVIVAQALIFAAAISTFFRVVHARTLNHACDQALTISQTRSVYIVSRTGLSKLT